VAHACNSSYSGGLEDSVQEPILKKPNTQNNRAGGVIKVVPIKYEALSSNPMLPKKEKKKVKKKSTCITQFI
jgi:hypothetical protein